MRKTISIQLHCFPDELLGLLLSFLPPTGIYFTLIRSFEKNSFTIERLSDLSVGQIKNWDELLVTLYCPQRDADNSFTFLDRNPNALVVNFSVPQDQSLEESCVSTVCYDSISYDIWKGVALKMKKKLMLGGEVRSDYNFTTGPLKTPHYYTVQAQKFFEAGGKLWLLGNKTKEFIPKGVIGYAPE